MFKKKLIQSIEEKFQFNIDAAAKGPDAEKTRQTAFDMCYGHLVQLNKAGSAENMVAMFGLCSIGVYRAFYSLIASERTNHATE